LPPTQKEIAKRLGVSQGLVSQILNGKWPATSEIHQHILRECQRLGYAPNHAASALRSGKKHAWGMVVPSFEWLADFNRRIVSGIWEVAHENQQSLSIISMDNPDPQDYTRQIRQGRFDGIFVFYNGDDAGHMIPFEEIQAIGIPMVVVNCPMRTDRTHYVCSEARDGVRQAVRHLIEVHGRKRIAFLWRDRQSWLFEDRYMGYLDAHHETGLAVDPALTQEFVELGRYEKNTKAIVDTLLERGISFDAICTPMDYTAISVLGYLQDRGIRVPADVSVTGFDNHHLSESVRPRLTTVFCDAPEMGRQAAKIMLDVLKNKEDRSIRKATIPTQLVVRQSCGCGE